MNDFDVVTGPSPSSAAVKIGAALPAERKSAERGAAPSPSSREEEEDQKRR